jgi:hypothetical protein
MEEHFPDLKPAEAAAEDARFLDIAACLADRYPKVAPLTHEYIHRPFPASAINTGYLRRLEDIGDELCRVFRMLHHLDPFSENVLETLYVVTFFADREAHVTLTDHVNDPVEAVIDHTIEGGGFGKDPQLLNVPPFFKTDIALHDKINPIVSAVFGIFEIWYLRNLSGNRI